MDFIGYLIVGLVAGVYVGWRICAITTRHVVSELFDFFIAELKKAAQNPDKSEEGKKKAIDQIIMNIKLKYGLK